MRILLFLLIVIFVSCSSSNEKAEKNESHIAGELNSGAIKLTDVKLFNKLISQKQVVLLDVRTPDEYNEGHILNSANVNIQNMESFSAYVAELNKSTPVYVYCKVGGRSNKAAEYLKSEGFSTIYDLDGGITAWINSGYETSK